MIEEMIVLQNLVNPNSQELAFLNGLRGRKRRKKDGIELVVVVEVVVEVIVIIITDNQIVNQNPLNLQYLNLQHSRLFNRQIRRWERSNKKKIPTMCISSASELQERLVVVPWFY